MFKEALKYGFFGGVITGLIYCIGHLDGSIGKEVREVIRKATGEK